MSRLRDRPNVWRRFLFTLGAAHLFAGSVQAAADEPSGGPPEAEPTESPIEHVIEESPGTRIYRTREEQRDAGLKRQITPWLAVSGLIEAELSHDDYRIEHGRDDASGHEDSANLQLGLTLDLFSVAEAEAVIEYDTDTDKVEADEAFITFERDPWELSLGRQYTPFGVYYSNFVSGPLLEFGETRANRAATLAYGPSDQLDASLSVYRGIARKLGSNAERWGWVFALEAEVNEGWSIGGSYQSDLADADSRPLADENNRYSRRVAGVSGYMLWAAEQYEVTLEALAATRSFKELEADRNQPWAWNMEAVRFFDQQNIEVAFRLEGSQELEDEPYIQFGLAATWRIGKYANLTLEYLHGEFKNDLATNDDDEPYDHVDRVGGQFTIEF